MARQEGEVTGDEAWVDEQAGRLAEWAGGKGAAAIRWLSAWLERQRQESNSMLGGSPDDEETRLRDEATRSLMDTRLETKAH
jgi:hypothetical protein